MEARSLEDIESYPMDYPDIYFTPGYGALCEISDCGKWSCLVSQNGTVLVPFIEKTIDIGNRRVRHLISNYGYGGFYNGSGMPVDWEAVATHLSLHCGCITHFIRFTPYFDINCDVDVVESCPLSQVSRKGTTYGISLKDTRYEEYIRSTAKNHRRSLRKSSSLSCTIRPIHESDAHTTSVFRDIYRETMDRVGSSGYYYFSTEYFRTMAQKLGEETLIVEVAIPDTGLVIASAIIFRWKNKYLHYHLGGSKTDYLHLCPNNRLHDEVVRYGFEHGYELYHLGGGVANGDALDKFKKGMSNKSYDFFHGKIVYDSGVYENLIEGIKYEHGEKFPPYYS